MSKPFSIKGATFSVCRTWRYALWRVSDDPGGKNVMFIGLNPSTANESEDDMTIRKCIGFAERWGFSGIYMLNLYGYCATDPIEMMRAQEPVGKHNIESIRSFSNSAAQIIAAWGGSIPAKVRPAIDFSSTVNRTLGAISQPVYCLGRTKSGYPLHPSRLAYESTRVVFSDLENSQ